MWDCKTCAYEHSIDNCAGGPIFDNDDDCPGYQKECNVCGGMKCQCEEMILAEEDGLL